MKKLILAFTALCFVLQAEAQICEPDMGMTEVGITPRNLPEAKVNVAYSEVIQFKFPTDTTFQGQPVSIDSAKVQSINGLPQGFTFACNKPNCEYKGGDNGCATISGTASGTDSTYKVIVTVSAKVNYGGVEFWVPFTDTIDFVVTNSTIINKKNITGQSFSVKQNYPNPFSRTTQIEVILPQPQILNFNVFNVLGTQVLSKKLNGQAGLNSLTFERGQLPAGMYFYTISHGNQVITKRMSIQNQ